MKNGVEGSKKWSTTGGTFLVLIMVLVYVNDMAKRVRSYTSLLANSAKLLNTIRI